MMVPTAEWGSAGSQPPYAASQHAHVWSFGTSTHPFTHSLLRTNTTRAHSTLFSNCHTVDLHVSYSNIQGEITVQNRVNTVSTISYIFPCNLCGTERFQG